MICPKCGTDSREGARYCDSCGELLVPQGTTQTPLTREEDNEDEEPAMRLVDSGGLTGWMATDWTLHFVGAAIVGILLGLVMIGMGQYAYSVFFFIIGIVGILGTRYMLNAKA